MKADFWKKMSFLSTKDNQEAIAKISKLFSTRERCNVISISASVNRNPQSSDIAAMSPFHVSGKTDVSRVPAVILTRKDMRRDRGCPIY